MKAWGFENREQSLRHIAALSSMRLENMRREGRAWAFKVVADGCSRRRAAHWGDRQGRLTRSPSFWAMALFVGRLFWIGASKVQSALGDWRNFADFDAALPGIADRNVGSVAYPCAFADLAAVPNDADVQEHYIKLANVHLEGYTSAIRL